MKRLLTAGTALAGVTLVVRPARADLKLGLQGYSPRLTALA